MGNSFTLLILMLQISGFCVIISTEDWKLLANFIHVSFSTLLIAVEITLTCFYIFPENLVHAKHSLRLR